jgi:hypothetical protein
MKTPSMLRAWAAALAGLVLCGMGTAHAHSYPPPPTGRLVQVEVYDRVGGGILPVYQHEGRRYIVGTPGHEYALRIRNRTGARVLVVTRVDGVNVVSGDTASPAQSGYVLEAWGSAEIAGWRKNLERTAAFFFTEHQNSYAARTGRPDNDGVIGVAVFPERIRPIPLPPPYPRPRIGAEPEAQSSGSGRAAEAPASAQAPAPARREADASGDLSRDQVAERSARPAAKLGTGHGRIESSQATVVSFERASDSPSETVVIQYDRRENLAAMGVLPAPTPLVRREPQPFPGTMRFAPDPDR